MGERRETDEDMPEAVGHCVVLVMFRDGVLVAAVEISGGSCRHRCRGSQGDR